MGLPVGVYKNGKLVRIIDKQPGQELKIDCDRLVDLSHRPDIKVGHAWGTEPDGYGTAYTIVDSKIVASAATVPVITASTAAPVAVAQPSVPSWRTAASAPAAAPVPDPSLTPPGATS